MAYLIISTFRLNGIERRFLQTIRLRRKDWEVRLGRAPLSVLRPVIADRHDWTNEWQGSAAAVFISFTRWRHSSSLSTSQSRSAVIVNTPVLSDLRFK